MRPRVKICCISSKTEADLAVQVGASALGLVSHMPSGPGVISEQEISTIVPFIPPGVASFLLTSAVEEDRIIAQQRATAVNCLQLVDAVNPEIYPRLRRRLAGVSLVQVIHVVDEGAVGRARRLAPYVDAILLDSGNPSLAVKQLGGTGRVHNWDISCQIVGAIEKPVYLAGGISADNVKEAIGKVRPFGIDLCSSVRTGDKLDPVKLKAVFAAVNSL